jgi:aspartyl-tRNA(Asn)/glutamyl-tRNA(Gln) amidotransferase subunit A
MTPADTSTADDSFDAARELLHGLPFADPAAPPPLELVGPHRPPYRPARSRAALPDHALRHRPTTVSVPYEHSSVVDAAADVAKGTTTSRQLAEEAIARAAERSDLGAVVHLDLVEVRRQADQLDAEAADGRLRGPLHGVPVTVKDIIHVTGMPTRAGSLAYEALAPTEGTAVARLREAGALIMAKVATHEFALGVTTPQCRNPFDPTVIAGGSSGGSAIAVATGVGYASLGTDTRASLRVPSALCGVVGFKPTLGRVPTDGIVPLSWTMDHLGPIAATVADATTGWHRDRAGPSRRPDGGRRGAGHPRGGRRRSRRRC